MSDRNVYRLTDMSKTFSGKKEKPTCQEQKKIFGHRKFMFRERSKTRCYSLRRWHQQVDAFPPTGGKLSRSTMTGGSSLETTTSMHIAPPFPALGSIGPADIDSRCPAADLQPFAPYCGWSRGPRSWCDGGAFQGDPAASPEPPVRADPILLRCAGWHGCCWLQGGHVRLLDKQLRWHIWTASIRQAPGRQEHPRTRTGSPLTSGPASI